MAATSIAKRQSKATDGEAIYRECRNSPPVMTDAEIVETERFLNDPRRHMWRRAAFGVQTMSGEDLFSKIESDRKSALVFAETALWIKDYVSRLRGLADLINAAQMRIELGLCARDDCQAVRAEAKKKYAAEQAAERSRGN